MTGEVFPSDQVPVCCVVGAGCVHAVHVLITLLIVTEGRKPRWRRCYREADRSTSLLMSSFLSFQLGRPMLTC